MREFKSYMKTVGGGEGDRCLYPTRFDMYGCGCYHNCAYCYARSLLEFRDLWDADNPHAVDKRKIIKQIEQIRPGTIVRLGGMTDPFQPLESKYHLTEWLIGELNKRRIGYLIVTKGQNITKCKGLHPQLAHIQISYTFTEGRAPKDYERAAPPEQRLREAEELYRRGYDVALRVSPYVPQFIDIDKVLDSPVEKVCVEFLRINGFIQKNMPYLDTKEWTLNEGGYRHLPLDRKLACLKPFIESGKQITVCEDVPSHYEYFKKNVNANPDDCCNLRR